MSPLSYSAYWRPNLEAWQMAGWLGMSGAALLGPSLSGLPAQPWWLAAATGGMMSLVRARAALGVALVHRRLRGRPVSWLTLAQLRRLMRRRPRDIWLGHGGEWQPEHTQAAFELVKANVTAVVDDDPNRLGLPWIHGVLKREERVWLPLAHSEGHILVVGTTGAGKTRLLDQLVSQAVLRGEAVIVVDPKGDRALCEALQRACAALGEPERFRYFHPAFPGASVKIDPMKNYARPTELASRITALMASGGESASFTAFSHMALTQVIHGLILTRQAPNLLNIRRYIEGSVEDLLERILGDFFAADDPAWTGSLPAAPGGDAPRLGRLIAFYQGRYASKGLGRPEISGLVSRYTHDRQHFTKMVASLLPILTQLTDGTMGELLSPAPTADPDDLSVTDTRTMLARNQVVYCGLDTLSDTAVGQAIGSILLADLVAVAGERYNFAAQQVRPVTVVVDEAAEVLCQPFIQLLNKGRGAGVRLIVATQTLADLEAKLGSAAMAEQVLANANNILALRVRDSRTQKYIADLLPETTVHYIMYTQGSSTAAREPLTYSANVGERLMDEMVPLFPQQLLGALPNFELIAVVSGGRVIKARVPILDEAAPARTRQARRERRWRAWRRTLGGGAAR